MPKMETKQSSYPWAHIPYDPNTVHRNAYEAIYPAESLSKRLFFNIGSGAFKNEYWTNVDYASTWYENQQESGIHINHDLLSLKPLPIPDNVAEAVYTSHTVEHITDTAAQCMFTEAWRILKPGGQFRVTTPDTDLHYRAWRRDDAAFFYWIGLYSAPDVCAKLNIHAFDTASLAQIFLFNFATHVSELTLSNTLPKISTEELTTLFDALPYEEALDICTARCPLDEQRNNPGFHINWWNETKTLSMLRKAGFTNIRRSGYGQSDCPAMRDLTLFDLQDPKVSLYMEATK